MDGDGNEGSGWKDEDGDGNEESGLAENGTTNSSRGDSAFCLFRFESLTYLSQTFEINI